MRDNTEIKACTREPEYVGSNFGSFNFSVFWFLHLQNRDDNDTYLTGSLYGLIFVKHLGWRPAYNKCYVNSG